MLINFTSSKLHNQKIISKCNKVVKLTDTDIFRKCLFCSFADVYELFEIDNVTGVVSSKMALYENVESVTVVVLVCTHIFCICVCYLAVVLTSLI